MTSDTEKMLRGDETVGPQCIFIVEDEFLVAFEMADLLEDLGFNVVGPSVHLADAMEKARTAKIDAAFLDVNLGEDKTSKPVADILRERKIPFVFVTAYDRNEISFLMSDDQVLKKPITSERLLSTLRKAFPDLEKK
ncbi:hypothetical protein HME9302_01678 [Alteripontixanthobacter maritimus]|uniref:Response regulatory domain-containing protein n=1 Tax=Alteripontixanthobacter maritimus TaxID=2161824 RepID=A0A369Q6H3_9SPHN|nr:response regulator [Alteripontixanthobacter maritimus]RDC60471.1 hypothetical protein HME9302_01678 [Alteripontixanthobacter maritimus]